MATSVAHGRLQDGPGGLPAPGAPRATAEGMLAALNWILAENSRQGSPFYQRIDASKIAVSGNSCGGLLALRVGQDPRVKTVILQNSGIIPAGANNAGLGGLTKADLAKLHTPVLYVLGGPDDIAQPNGMDDFQRINHVAVFVADKKNAGHFGVFIEPNGRGTEIEIDWMKWQLENDQVAEAYVCGRRLPALQRAGLDGASQEHQLTFLASNHQFGLWQRPHSTPANIALAFESPLSCQSSHAVTTADHSGCGSL